MNNTIKVETVNGGYAEMIKHSISKEGKEAISISVKYGLIVHAEALRHRDFSRGVKSNRAIPCKNIRKEVLDDPYVPVWFGANQKGMSANYEVRFKSVAKFMWKAARYPAVGVHWFCDKILGGHKEWVNRIINPWQWVRETITATEWENFFTLRVHEDAQKDIRVIAEAIKKICDESVPELLENDEWHTPYVKTYRNFETNELVYLDNDGSRLTAEQAIHASAARCARSSYDNHDGTHATYENDIDLYNQLIESKPEHASPVEHPCRPVETFVEGTKLNDPYDFETWEPGITHMRRNGDMCSGNFVGWIQSRHINSSK